MQGIIIRSTGSWYEIRSEDTKRYKARLRGKFKNHDLKVTNPIAVGDKVEFEIENITENSALITSILPRQNYVIRKSVHKSAHGHLIASNLDQAVLITTPVFPATSVGFIDRFLVSTEAFRIPAVIVFNKTDLYNEDIENYVNELISIYEPLGYKCIKTSALENKGIEDLIHILKNKKSLISGHSGVGKSSLVNAISPELKQKISEVSTFANKGVHTTTFAEMFEIDANTFIIDTPGIKELGLFDINEEELGHFFPEMRALLNECKFHNCKHINEPKCAVIEKVKSGEIASSRYQSYISMLDDYDSHR